MTLTMSDTVKSDFNSLAKTAYLAIVQHFSAKN